MICCLTATTHKRLASEQQAIASITRNELARRKMGSGSGWWCYKNGKRSVCCCRCPSAVNERTKRPVLYRNCRIRWVSWLKLLYMYILYHKSLRTYRSSNSASILLKVLGTILSYLSVQSLLRTCNELRTFISSLFKNMWRPSVEFFH